MDPNQSPQPTTDTQQQPVSQPPEALYYPAQPHLPPEQVSAPTGNPGKKLGIASFVLVFVGLGLISVIIGIIAYKKSKRAGYRNGLAVAGIILGSIEIILGIFALIIVGNAIILLVTTCNEYGIGTHVLTNGAQLTCN